jgi:hypothetical protein
MVVIHIHFTNPITVLVLEVLALFFGEEYVREKKLGGLRNYVRRCQSGKCQAVVKIVTNPHVP